MGWKSSAVAKATINPCKNLSARSHDAAQPGLRQVATPIRRRNSDLRTPPGRHGTPACRMVGLRVGAAGPNPVLALLRMKKRRRNSMNRLSDTGLYKYQPKPTRQKLEITESLTIAID